MTLRSKFGPLGQPCFLNLARWKVNAMSLQETKRKAVGSLVKTRTSIFGFYRQSVTVEGHDLGSGNVYLVMKISYPSREMEVDRGRVNVAFSEARCEFRTHGADGFGISYTKMVALTSRQM